MYKVGEKVRVKLSTNINDEKIKKLLWKIVTIKEITDGENSYKIEEDGGAFFWYWDELETIHKTDKPEEQLIDDDRLDELMTTIVNHKEKADIMEALYDGVKLKEELSNIKEGIETNSKRLLNLLKS